MIRRIGKSEDDLRALEAEWRDSDPGAVASSPNGKPQRGEIRPPFDRENGDEEDNHDGR